MFDRVRAWFAQPQSQSQSQSQPGGGPGAPGDTAEFEARLKTIARAQSKISLRLDELGEQVEGNHRAVLERLDAGSRSDIIAVDDVDDTIDVDDILDALDRLDDARRSLGAEQAALADGLAAIMARLDRFIVANGLLRHAQTGVKPDGQRFRVVGTQDDPAMADGVVIQVIRSAVTRDGALVRQGEVIANKRAP